MIDLFDKIKNLQIGWLRRWLTRVFFLVTYLLTKLKFLLPKQVEEQLPTAWNNRMWWVAIKSGGDEIYGDYYCELKTPPSYKPKVEGVPEEFRLSEEDIKFFYENGYIGPFDLISEEEARDLEAYLKNLIENTESSIYPFSKGYYEIDGNKLKDINNAELSNFEAALKMINSRDRHLDEPRILNLFKKPAITERCAQLLGPDLMVWRSRFFSKQPGESGTAWHQASVYLSENMKTTTLQPPDLSELFQLTVFTSLSEASIENGCMTLIPGTNKKIYTYTVETFDPTKETKGRFGMRKIDVNYPIDPEKVKKIIMKPGQFYIFSERTIHGSLDNISQDKSRFSLVCRVIRPETKVYDENIFKKGHGDTIYKVRKLNLENWRAVMIRGEDRVKVNRSEPVTFEPESKEAKPLIM